jgi:hypothetical protein
VTQKNACFVAGSTFSDPSAVDITWGLQVW